MRTAEEILENYWNKKNYQQAYFVDQQSALIAAINEARKEAIEEVSKLASKCLEETYRIDYLQDTEFSSLIKELK